MQGRRKPQPLEHRLLLTATLCLLAGGAVMVYSASSARTLLEGDGDGTAYLVKYLVYGAAGLVLMHLVARQGLASIRRYTPHLLLAAFVLLVLVLLPGFGVKVNGARRWLGAGPLQFQPAEIMKLALVLHSASVIAPRRRPDPRPQRGGAPADRRPARPRHRTGHLLHARRDADRRRAAAPPARP